MTDKPEHEGWKNKATWQIHTWFGNAWEERDGLLETAHDALANLDRAGAIRNVASAVEDEVKAVIEDSQGSDTYGLASDLIATILETVDYDEIATELVDDALNQRNRFLQDGTH